VVANKFYSLYKLNTFFLQHCNDNDNDDYGDDDDDNNKNKKITRAKVIWRPHKSPLSVGDWGPCLIQCYLGLYEYPCHMASHSIERH